MWGVLAPCRTPYAETCMCSKYLIRSNGLPNFSIVALCIMQLCEYVFAVGFPLYVPKSGFWGVLRVNMSKCVLTPKSTTLREYASVGVSHVKIGSRSVERFLRTKK